MMSNRGEERRCAERRLIEDRRKEQIPVENDRRSEIRRRSDDERRSGEDRRIN
jgi:hypothetical protein